MVFPGPAAGRPGLGWPAQTASRREFSSWISRCLACISLVRSAWPASKSLSIFWTSTLKSLLSPAESFTSSVAPFHLATAARTWRGCALLGLFEGHHRPSVFGLPLEDQGLAVVPDRNRSDEHEPDVLHARFVHLVFAGR